MTTLLVKFPNELYMLLPHIDIPLVGDYLKVENEIYKVLTRKDASAADLNYSSKVEVGFVNSSSALPSSLKSLSELPLINYGF